MRVGVLSYPMLFQRSGGLQIQVRETVAALNAIGVEARLADPVTELLSSYDVVHVFSTISGNYRIVESAREQQVPLVLSPLLSPEWNRGNGRTARLLDRLVGRLSGWQVQTSYGQMASALQGADRLLALGEAEAAALQSAFGIERARIDICPNGIAPRFFDADPGLFRQAYGIDGPFVLMTGAISPYKNQLGVVRALAGSGLRCVLIGRAERAHAGYLELLQREPGVRWLGPLDHGDPLLASAYAAAAVLALLSQGEVQPLSVLEALAAGTPAVMTSRSALVVPGSGAALRTVDWQDGPGIRQAIEALLRTPPPRAQVAQLVAEWRWEQVAQRIAANYRQALAQRR